MAHSRSPNDGSCVPGRFGTGTGVRGRPGVRVRLAADDGGSRAVSFNHQIRPLLSDRCFSCHGPDERARKGKLRLDTAEDVLAPRGARGDRWVLVPGDPEQSELYLRITSEDEMDLMPPAESNLKLAEEEKALIRRWIEEGAEYQPHWAFIPVAEVEVPRPAESLRLANPIDAFVQARLEREGMGLAPMATRETLIRRLRFDLTGLPPSLEEIDAFLADDAPDAYERLVDRLLAEPAYGERRANEWLDLARYADTYGYQSDVEVDLSPWRDWVIRAFNENLAYDQFVTWQLAGDLLPSPSRDQVLATAFNRLHRQTNEGGSIEEEFRTEYAADRVQTAGTAFLGLTLECARCHDHKFDPISQKDFFRMFAFFNNIDESGLYSHFTRATPTPTMLLYPEGMEAGHRALRDKIAGVEVDRARHIEAARKRFEEWLDSTEFVVVQPEPAAAFDFERIEGEKTMDPRDTNRVATLVDGPLPVEGSSGRALRFNGDNLAILKGVGAFNRTSAFSFSLWVRPAEVQERAVIFHRSRAWTDSGSRGYELVLEEMRPAFGLVHFWPGNAIQVRARGSVAGGGVVAVDDHVRRVESRRRDPALSRWRAAGGRNRARSSVQGHRPSEGMGRCRRGPSRVDFGRSVSGFGIQRRGDRRIPGLRSLFDAARSSKPVAGAGHADGQRSPLRPLPGADRSGVSRVDGRTGAVARGGERAGE